MQQQLIKINKIKGNSGQIDGLPKNPRIIKDDKYKKLLKSIEDDPEMLDLRELIVYPFEDNYIVIAGNMRLKALTELKYKEVNCKVLDAETPVEKLMAYIIKDNVGFGEHDWNLLANEWDAEQLTDWGVDIGGFDTDLDYSDKNKEIDTNFENQKYTFKLEYTEGEYTELKEKINKIGKTPEQIFYEALI